MRASVMSVRGLLSKTCLHFKVLCSIFFSLIYLDNVCVGLMQVFQGISLRWCRVNPYSLIVEKKKKKKKDVFSCNHQIDG